MPHQLKYLLFVTLFWYNAAAQLLPFKNFTAKDGLISNEVTSTITDKRGILWIGTPFGINWYDGNHFTEPNLRANRGQLYVTRFFKDQTGNIWTLTFYNGLYKFDNDRFTNFLPDKTNPASNSNTVFDIIEHEEGKFLVATDNNIFWFDGSTFQFFDEKNPELRQQITTIGYEKNKWLFFGYSKGIIVYRKSGSAWEYATHVLKDRSINEILIDDHQVWVSTESGLLNFKNPGAVVAEDPAKKLFDSKAVAGVTINPLTGEHWICADKLYRIKDDAIKEYDNDDGLTSIPGSIYFDHENTGWLASGNGLIRLVDQKNVFYDLRKGPGHSMITTINADNQNDLWLGSFSGLVRKKNNELTPFRAVAGKEVGYVSWLLRTQNNELLGGTAAGIISIENSRLILLKSMQTTKAYEDKNGIIWLATTKGEVFTLKDNQIKNITLQSGIPDFIDAICVDNHSYLWIGYRGNGIRKYSTNGTQLQLIKEYSINTGFPDLQVRCSFIDRNGNILFGTRTSGLFIISAENDDKTWHINTEHGLSANWIKSIAQDRFGRILLATNRGVNMMGADYNHATPRKIDLSFEQHTNVANYIYISGETAWIGTETGIVEYDQSAQRPGSPPPQVYITEVSVNGSKDTTLPSYFTSTKKSFEPGNNIIAFGFAGIDLSSDAPLQYRYKLEGQDRDWIDAGDRNFVSYNLPAGKYKFMVAARQPNGEWSTNPAEVTFNISTPFWKSAWFAAAVLIILSSVVFVVYRYRQRQKIKLERLRTRISTDLHDDIGSTLSSISILSDIAAQEKDPGQSREMISEIKQSSVSLMEKMDDIVWSINPRHDSIEELLLRIKRFASKLFEAKDIDYCIHIDESIHAAKLDMETRQHIYLIMKEAINNLVKYAGCTHAIIDVRYNPPVLKIEIRDNGKGFHEATTLMGNGIISMRKRAEAIHASIDIDSGEGNGTVVILQTKIK